MCIFCKLASGEIPTEVIYEDEDIFVFKDQDPKAPVHMLLIPKKHISSLNEINQANSSIVSKIFEKIPELAKEYGFNDSGYRVVSNCGLDGGQSVDHIHFHLMAKRKMEWPAG